jgi:DedD protein
MAEPRDTEITLGTGRLLGLFFGLAVLLAVFFGLGYSMGKGSAKPLTSENLPLPPPVSNPTKPAASKAAPAAKDCASNPQDCGAADLSFYKAVEQKDTTQLASETPEPKPVEPEIAKPALGTGYVVQVAAVSKQEDADALVSALRKKQYAVFITNGSSDKLFHVQVGPFADLKEAEAMRAKLTGDGYNPILKR